jgi:hypothetical protein
MKGIDCSYYYEENWFDRVSPFFFTFLFLKNKIKTWLEYLKK